MSVTECFVFCVGYVGGWVHICAYDYACMSVCDTKNLTIRPEMKGMHETNCYKKDDQVCDEGRLLYMARISGKC